MPFIYSDESQFGSSDEFVGVGLLITEAEVPKEVVEAALEKLRDDPDRLRPDRRHKDERTLERGHFHACEDSANGHSHLCDAINKFGRGEFACDFFDKRKFSPRARRSLIYEQAMTMAALHLSTRESVTMIFAKRSGLTLEKLRLWYRKHERTLAESVYGLPFLPLLFPRCEFKITSMEEPGLQLADFILWAHARNASADPKWLSRIQAGSRALGKDVGSAHRGHLVLGPLVQPDSLPYGPQDMPPLPDEAMTQNDALNLFVNAVRLVIHLHQDGCPAHVAHLKEEIDGIANRVIQPQSTGLAEDVAFMYIRLADTMPLIDEGSALQEKQKFLLAKRLMSLVLRGDLISGMRTRNWFEHSRRLILKKQPELLRV
jgi:hypothetical protein